MTANLLARLRPCHDYPYQGGPVVYWLSRDQRAQDNWALLYAQQLALDHQAPLAVVFNLVPQFLQAAHRQYDFMLRGLRETAQVLEEHRIPFFLLQGEPQETLPAFLAEQGVGALISDFDPLRLKRQWQEQVRERIAIPFWQVDAHNIIPCWLASAKREFAAYTLRPKIHRLLPDFLTDLPPLQVHPVAWPGAPPVLDWGRLLAGITADRAVLPVSWCRPGAAAARECLQTFLSQRLPRYHLDRNDPTVRVVSDLSPYLHFGQIAAQRVAWEVRQAEGPAEAKQAFLEELIVRRELADNFCYYNAAYDQVAGFPEWAQKTLDQHRRDQRDYLYELPDWEAGRTHDDLWNAAQLEMVRRGKMHGYLRMYWAKKILEWSASPEEALATAIYLNDRYELDGRDPNGYVGVAWSIGGVHDRPWGERPVFGKIRYMSRAGCQRKFRVEQYMAWVRDLPEGGA
ncbi:MAG: deoxyribodipyrimidine photo-lyase [Desulfobacca sp.]|uniref:deoxyribodipyrimidine photo-lyase n=1 Tax=Desulfobacca sp. TaxID=2067990 RepID=UPI00404A4C68